jgi:hypothetical protein
MSTEALTSRANAVSLTTWKACFVISPIGADDSPERQRADHVLDTYIAPACKSEGYGASRADEDFAQSIRDGIVTSLDRAPMCIAYLGAPPWNDNVMVELGYRIAARLPVVLLCDAAAGGEHLPYLVHDRRVIELPRADQESELKIASVRTKIATAIKAVASDFASQTIQSALPVAIIHSFQPRDGSPLDPKKMIYVRASEQATEIFGIRQGGETHLAGKTMCEFLENLKYRMTRSQYQAFIDSQGGARSEYSTRLGQGAEPPPTVDVPIVFKWHPVKKYVGRAFLPIITEDFRARDNGWSSLRVLYLDVTSAKDLHAGSDEGSYYVCKVIKSDPPVDPEKPKPITLFLSHNSAEWNSISPFFERLADFTPWIEPWVDRKEIMVGGRFVADIGAIIDRVEVAFIFLGPNGIGNFQRLEIESLVNELSRRTDVRLLPIYLDGYNAQDLPAQLRLIRDLSAVPLNTMSDDYLADFFYRSFPDRFYK